MAGASRDRLQELVAMVVERVQAADRQVAAIVWQPAARPFFEPSAISTLGDLVAPGGSRRPDLPYRGCARVLRGGRLTVSRESGVNPFYAATLPTARSAASRKSLHGRFERLAERVQDAPAELTELVEEQDTRVAKRAAMSHGEFGRSPDRRS